MTLEELQWRRISQSLVWADSVIGALPGQQLTIYLQQVPALRCDLVEFLVVCAMGTFDLTIEFRRAGRQHEQRQLSSLTGLLEFGGEFAAAVDLHGADGKGHAAQQGFQEGERAGGVRSGVSLQDVPPRDQIARREVVQDHAGFRTHLLGVQGHQIAGLAHPPKTGLARGPGTMAQLAALSDEHGRSGSFHQHAPAFQIGEHAANHGSRQRKALFKEDVTQLVFAPARILTAHREHPVRLLGRPGGSAEPVRTMRAPLQRSQLVWVIAAPPAVEALPADPEMAAGESRVASVVQVVIHPLKPPNRVAAQLPPRIRQLAESGWLSPSNLHGDTLLRVSPIILNENRFGLSNRRVPDSIVEAIFFRWGADLFKNCGFCSHESDFVAHPRFRVGLWVSEGHGHFQSIGIDAAPAFLEAHLVAMWISEVV